MWNRIQNIYKCLCLFTVLVRFYFVCFLSGLVATWVTWGSREFHLVMALFSTVRASVLDLGTVKRPLVACLVLYRWVSELCANCLNRQFSTFNTSTPRTTTNSDAVNLSSTLSQERFTCILLTSKVQYVLLCSVTFTCPLRHKWAVVQVRQN